MGLEKQKELTNGKGGWNFVKAYAKEEIKKVKTKAKIELGGVDVVIKK